MTNDYPPIHNGLTTHNDPDDRFAIYRACSCLDSKETGSYSYGGKPPHLKGWRPAPTRGSASLFTVLASIYSTPVNCFSTSGFSSVDTSWVTSLPFALTRNRRRLIFPEPFLGRFLPKRIS